MHAFRDHQTDRPNWHARGGRGHEFGSRDGHHGHGGPRGGDHGGGRDHWDDDGRGPGGRRRRMFDGSELRLVLLKLVAEKTRHGYDLIRAIEERTGGGYVPSPGIVYPTLTMLAEMGLTDEQTAEGARKLFAITESGTIHLETHAADVTAIFARFDALGAMREKTDAMPVRRAMHNLRSVLLNRLGAGLDNDRMHDAVALIDETARKIERL
jgi:DNA-binding PadR family transcriptional regulator